MATRRENNAGPTSQDQIIARTQQQEEMPPAHQRSRYNKQGQELTTALGTRFPKHLYEHYRRAAYFKRVHVRDLIGQAMEAYLPQLKTSQTQRLKEAGQAELPVDVASPIQPVN